MSAVIKSHYSAAELAAMKLPGLPSTGQNINSNAKRDGWAFQRRTGRGGGVEYALSSLPAEAQAAVKKRSTIALIGNAPLALFEQPIKSGAMGIQQALPGLTDKERLIADARKGVLLRVARIQQGAGCSLEAALTTILTQAEAGEVEPSLLAMLRAAKTPRGRKSHSDLPSVRTLKRFIALDKCNDLAPKKVQKDMRVPEWAASFLSHYQQPQKPTVAAAYAAFLAAPHGAVTPSIHQVRRFIDKIGNVSREVGRMGTRDIKNIKGFKRRSFDDLLPGDIYSADGHCFDAEIRHPLSGKPFRPEITSIIDIATRKLVGFSIDLAESGFAVIDALRYAVVQNGVCAIFYVDNGSGYVNYMMKDEATGLMGRLGITMEHSIAYNSQARGVIERFHQFWTAAAKTLDSYLGADMDRQARQAHFKLSRKALKQGGAVPLMTFADFVAWCHQKADEYNDRPHRSLGGKSPNQRWHELAQQSQQVMLSAAEAEVLFKPQVTRKAIRCEIQLFGNTYHSAELEEFHGDMLRVAYDIHDAKWVWLYDKAGRFVCKAEWNGNKHAYYAKPVIELRREQREDARIKRHEGHISDIESDKRAPLAGEITYQPSQSINQESLRGRLATGAQSADVIEAELVSLPTAQVMSMQEMTRPLFQRTAEKYRWLMTHRGAWAEADRGWMQSYVNSDEYADRADVYEFEGIAWQGDSLMEAVG